MKRGCFQLGIINYLVSTLVLKLPTWLELATESWRADDSIWLLVLFRLGKRWSLHRNEPAWVVGEHRHEPPPPPPFEPLVCLVIIKVSWWVSAFMLCLAPKNKIFDKRVWFENLKPSEGSMKHTLRWSIWIKRWL